MSLTHHFVIHRSKVCLGFMGLPYLNRHGPSRALLVLVFLLLFTGAGFRVANSVAGTSLVLSTLNLIGVVMGGLVVYGFLGDSVSSSNGSGAIGWFSSGTTTSLCGMLIWFLLEYLNLGFKCTQFLL